MLKTDVNGNTVSTNRNYCMQQIRDKKTRVDTDAAGRVMVDLEDGGTIWFFAYNEPRITKKLGVHSSKA